MTAHWVEVFKKQVDGEWISFDGQEQVILADLAEISGGQKGQTIQSRPMNRSRPAAGAPSEAVDSGQVEMSQAPNKINWFLHLSTCSNCLTARSCRSSRRRRPAGKRLRT